MITRYVAKGTLIHKMILSNDLCELSLRQANLGEEEKM